MAGGLAAHTQSGAQIGAALASPEEAVGLIRTALRRALRLGRSRDEKRRAHLDAIAKEQGWLSAAQQAAYGLQFHNLHLRPWQPPPMFAVIDDDDGLGPVGGRKAAAELLRRLLAAGLSRFEPDPLSALERVEQAAREAAR
jgi:hypothetical protein